MMEPTRVAIIGAGPSGLAALDAFVALKNQGIATPEFVCFERQSGPGGIWNCSYRVGFDEHGEPIHSSMYKYLWSNGPKECLEMANYTFQEHFGKPIPSYPPREVLADYLFGRMRKNGLEQYIQYNHAIRDVRFNEGTQKFTMQIENTKECSTQTQVFDYVICATGHFSIPNTPHFEGMQQFPGRILHAHDFRDAAEFKGQDVLLIGTSYSAEDIASQCWKYGAKSITISHRTRPCGFDWPKEFSEVPLLQRLEGKTAHFKDGTSKHIDSILLCTGYLHKFPFLEESLKLKCANTLWIDGLYNSVVFTRNPRMFFCGMQDQYFTFNLFDLQSYYAVDVITGHITLPSKEEMDASDVEFRARFKTLNGYEDDIKFQADYMKNMANACRYPKFDIDAMSATFFEWEHTKHGDIMGYRDHGHKSCITGHMAPIHPVKWVAEFDDSLENFKKEIKAPSEAQPQLMKKVVPEETKVPEETQSGDIVHIIGSGECDQLGLGVDKPLTARPLKIPYFVNAPIEIQSISCGGMHTAVLTGSGSVLTWGCNDEGVLGRDGPENEPIEVPLSDPIRLVATGDSHTIVVTQSDQVYFWGTYRDGSGAMIDVTKEPKILPDIKRLRIKEISKIVSGAHHTLLLAKGQVYAWGDSECGKIGRLPGVRRRTAQSLKVESIGVKKAQDIFCGSLHSFLLDCDGDLLAFGLNNYGQLGIGNMINTHVPYLVQNISDVESVTGGEHHTIALTKSGEVFAWGRNDDGQLGLGHTKEQTSPQKIENVYFSRVSAGGYYNYALDSESNVWTWGSGDSYVLGNGAEDEVMVPTRHPRFPDKYDLISTGSQHACLVSLPLKRAREPAEPNMQKFPRLES